LIERIEQKHGESFDVSEFIFASVSNVICSIVFGDQFDHNDEKFQQLLQSVHNIISQPFNGLLNTIPFLRQLPGNLLGQKTRQSIISAWILQ